MGYGQRGLSFSYGVNWPRRCSSQYCWEVTTNDIEQMKKLFDFPWNSYYKEYYIQGCGGAWDTPHQNPYILIPSVVLENGRSTKAVWMHKNSRKFVTLNVTVNATVTTEGGTFNMPLNWACNKDFCNSAPAGAMGASAGTWAMMGAATAAAILGSAFLSSLQ